LTIAREAWSATAMTKIKIATWNINSVRLRAGSVAKFVEIAQPDILCLQEIKCRNEEFPSAAFVQMGLPHLVLRGQKGWHGVAIASKFPLIEIVEPRFCMHEHARVASAQIGEGGPVIHNLYVPAGGDIPDVEKNEKFAHKLDFLGKMEAYYLANKGGRHIVVGDLNVAPNENDVWSHKALLDVVSHTPVETELLERLRKGGGLVDVARAANSMEEKLFSWWSYRSADWTVNNRGRRLDHIWISENITNQVDLESFTIHAETRSWEKPSDHVPVSLEMEV